MQSWCGDYWGSVRNVKQQTMVDSAGEGVVSHGFGRGPGSGGSAGVDSVVDVCSGYI